MRFLDEVACGRWAKGFGSLDPREPEGVPGTGWATAPGSIEKLAASQQMELAEWTVKWLEERDPPEMLLWVRLSEVWSENLFLYRLIRRKHLSVDGVEQTPGHLFGRDEREDGVAVLLLAMVYGWDVLVLPRGGQRCVFVDHDGHVSARAESAEARVEFLESGRA